MDKTVQHPGVVAIDDVRRDIEAYCGNYFKRQIASADALDRSYGDLWRSIERLFQSGGKRLRPYILFLAHEAYGGGVEREQVLPAAAACELLHQAFLMHDDIIDRDTVRYGVKNITGQYEDIYHDLVKDPIERRHYANSAALLAGDLLIAECYRMVATCHVRQERVLAAIFTLSRSLFDEAGGELIDTEAAFRGEERASAYTIALYKSASYTLNGPLVMGAQLAGLTDKGTVATLQEFGNAVGVAFQLQDDIMGVFGDSNVTGKSTTSDIREGKRTYMVEWFLMHAEPAIVKDFLNLFGRKDISNVQVQEAAELLQKSCAREHTEQRIDSLYNESMAAVDLLRLSPSHDEAFRHLARMCIYREK